MKHKVGNPVKIPELYTALTLADGSFYYEDH
jgi:hypothetical protein